MSYINACGNNKPNDYVMIGDDLVLDIENATKAGLNTIWVNSKNILHHNARIKVVKKIEEINEKLIEKIYRRISGFEIYNKR